MTTSLEQRETLYTGGDWMSASGVPNDVVDPSTEELLTTVPAATKADVERALASAHAAAPDWRRLPAVERGDRLRAIADVLVAHTDDLAASLVSEVGKPLALAKREITRTAEYIRYSAAWDRRIEGEILPSDNPGESIHLLRTPIGVVAAICAWNYPISLYFRKVAPALVAGNTVVVKPSETTPLTSLQVTRLIADHGLLPPGVLNLVTGARATGEALVQSDQTDMITFTGHRDTGKAIMAAAARNLTRVSLELGGKAPAIIMGDADLEMAVRATLRARHTNSGQVCTCAERVFVEESIFDAFVDRYVSLANELRIGSPWDTVDMGPLVSKAQFEKNAAAVEQATFEGARIIAGGGKPPGDQFERGFWFAPTVLTDVSPDMAIMRDETFGPVTPIMPFGSLSDAFEYANDSRYGLSAYLFTRSYETVLRASEEIRFGELFINRPLGEAMQAHHAGHRESGLGGEDGKHGVVKYTQLRAVYHNATDPYS
jgi:lactaldehyde dehydrogenase / glycolaldehyde dehydrogenase